MFGSAERCVLDGCGSSGWNLIGLGWVQRSLAMKLTGLFRASTVVTVGNGLHASFWDSSCLGGQAPRDIAPNLYKLAWRKRNTVVVDLHNQNWTRGLWRMSTMEDMAEYIILWDKL